MKKMIVKVLAAFTVFNALNIAVAADDYPREQTNWQVTFNGTNPMDSNFTSETIAQSLDGMQPGDKADIVINVKNSYKTTTDWYLDNSVITSFEDTNVATGGAYTYKLSYKGPEGTRDLYDSSAVGGEGSTGLHEVESFGDETQYVYLGELKTNEGGAVTLHIELDGETQDNSYQEMLARVDMKFAVELPATETPKPRQRVEHIHQDKIIYLPNTGDESNILLYAVTFIVSLVLLVVAGYQLKKATGQK